MNRLIYDIEIIKAIPTKEPRIEGIEYCDGWHDYKNMGIAVIGFKYNDEPASHCETVDEFRYLLEQVYGETCSLIGFNSKSFDDRVLEDNYLVIETDYDLLEQVRIAAGFKSHFQSVPRGYSYKLDALAKANGMAKIESGVMSPVLWQKGEHDRVREYCKSECEITAAILELGLSGELVDPNTGNKLQLAGLE